MQYYNIPMRKEEGGRRMMPIVVALDNMAVAGTACKIYRNRSPFHLRTIFGCRVYLHIQSISSQRNKRINVSSIKASLISDADAFQVGKFIGSYGFMNITGYSSFQPGGGFSTVGGFEESYLGDSSGEIEKLRVQDVGEGDVKIRLYEGRVAQGPLRGTRVIVKVYPGQRGGGIEADMMAANELNTHASLQNFVTYTIEAEMDEAGSIEQFQHVLAPKQAGPPGSILPSPNRLRDLAFSVDIGYSSLESGSSPFSEGLWRRASRAGAFSPLEKRAFRIADDMQVGYEAGLLFAYLAFVPFCESGSMDGLSLQRLFESTFQLDLEAAREYCQADDRLLEAVKFLDLGNGAGWELLQAMLNRNYRQRPTAEAELNHQFMTGALL